VKLLEDFFVGQQFVLALYTVDEQAIIDFATAFDPQPFHTLSDHPRTQALGGLMASGWHTTAIFMRLAVDAYMSDAAIFTSPGVDNVRWLAPVRAGDTVEGCVTITSARASASKPDRGIVQADARLWNQDAVAVLSLSTTAFIATREGFKEAFWSGSY